LTPGFALEGLLHGLEGAALVDRALDFVVVVEHEDHFVLFAAERDLGDTLLVVEEVA